MSLIIATLAILSVIARNCEAPPIPQIAPWVSAQTTEQINDLRDQVDKLRETVESQLVEIQRLRTEVQTAQSMVQEVKNPRPVGHAGPVLIQSGN